MNMPKQFKKEEKDISSILLKFSGWVPIFLSGYIMSFPKLSRKP